MGEIKEIFYKVFTKETIEDMVLQKKCLLLKARRPVMIGRECLLKVNMNVGVSDIYAYDLEVKKIKDISKLPYRPDSMMDHTIVKLKKPLWKTMIEEFDGAVGTLPHYLPFTEESGINENEFFNNLIEMAEGGVSFMTLHPTADLNLYKRAIKSNRIVPTTSRGGYVLLKDQAINNRTENIIVANFDKIMSILKKNNVAVSIGTVFRPATIHEALDEFHREEILMQKKYIDLAKKHGVQVMMEGIGHISIDMMEEYASLIRPFDTPLMPLGPMVSDEIIGFDHITNAIGTITMSLTGVLGMINSVTREEHTGRVPSYDSIMEGLMSARVSAHAYNISKFKSYRNETEVIGVTRGKNLTCVQRGGIFNYQAIDENESESCTRCRRECPLKKIKY